MRLRQCDGTPQCCCEARGVLPAITYGIGLAAMFPRKLVIPRAAAVELG